MEAIVSSSAIISPVRTHPSPALAPLRTADWRYLLPQVPHAPLDRLVLLGGVEGLAERLIQLGVAKRITQHLPCDHSIDAVIVLHGWAESIPRIAASLKPGGVLYLEVSRKLRGWRFATPDRVRKALLEKGLVSAGAYAIAPDPEQAMLYLPLDVPGAFPWYMKTLYNPSTVLRRLLGRGIGLAQRLGLQSIGPVLPWYAITAVALTRGSTMPALLTNKDLPPEFMIQHLSPLLLSDSGNRVVMLPFSKSGSRPEFVLKVPKIPSVNNRTEKEQHILRQLHKIISPELQETIPRPLGMLQHGEIEVAVETYSPGDSMKRSTRGSRRLSEKLHDLDAASKWLSEFHRQAKVASEPWGSSQIERWIEVPLDAYRHAFGKTADEQYLFRRALAYAISLRGSPFPVVWQHRDFNIWNVLRTKAGVHVIDWEGGRPGPALCDLIHFITHWNEAVRRFSGLPARVQGFETLWLRSPAGADRVRRRIDEALRSYMRALDLDERFLPLLLLYTWVELALRRAEQQRDQEINLPDPRAGNSNFAFIDVLVQNADELLPHPGHQ